MQRGSICRVLQLSLVPLLLALAASTAVQAKTAKHKVPTPEAGQPAPRFDVRTLEGQTFTNASLEGSVILLQFWTTRCPRCADDEAAVDEIDRRFINQGLVVLAIDEGESAATVGNYLHEHPRTSRVALDERKELARRFGIRRYPYYVVINRQGRVAAAEPGAAGEKGLLLLVSSAGLRELPKAQQTASRTAGGTATPAAKAPGEPSVSAPPRPTPPKVVEVPPERNAQQAKPLPTTVFVLTSGEHLESDHYTLDAHTLRIAVDGQERTIPTSALDINATQAANRARGVDVKIPTHGNEVFVAF